LTKPKYVTYVDGMNAWWPPSSIAGGLGVPGYEKTATKYNVFVHAFWISGTGPVDAAIVWTNAATYFSDGSFGTTNTAI